MAFVICIYSIVTTNGELPAPEPGLHPLCMVRLDICAQRVEPLTRDHAQRPRRYAEELNRHPGHLGPWYFDGELVYSPSVTDQRGWARCAQRFEVVA